MRVLVVEDERQLADSIAEGLRLHAMAVDVAYDGETGLERASVNDYDVLVLDLADEESVVQTRLCSTATCPLSRVTMSARHWFMRSHRRAS